jgi:hypothetical protein
MRQGGILSVAGFPFDSIVAASALPTTDCHSSD